MNYAFALAKTQHKPILLDFYADWCISCKEMESRTFTDPKVKNLLQQFMLLRADISADNADDLAMIRYFNVVAPPTIIFFNSECQ